jgi:mRNA-degrading endonuclease RelE of RelBE toxin-antitoxin system
MSFEIVYKPVVVKQLKMLPVVEQKKVLQKLLYLQENPFMGKQLKGELAGLRSLRAWPYRIIYELLGQKITVVSVAHRRDVYKAFGR